MTRPVDERLVRRRSRRVAVQVTAVVGVTMLVIVALATLVVVRGQQSATDRLLSTTARTADDVGDPPAGAWLVIVRGGAVSSSPGLPEELGPALAQRRGARGLSTIRAGDEDYRIVVVQRPGELVQVALDLGPQHEQRDRLLSVMGAAAAVSLLVAGGVGALIGRQAVRPLADALALQRTFVADASHELRTPLTLLSTRVQVLERSLPPDLPPAVVADLRGVRADVQRLGDVVEDLLVAATPDSDDEHAPADLGAVVTEVLDSARAHATQAGVELVEEGDGPVPVLVSLPAVRRAVLSLVDNAVDHTPPGGTVTVSTQRRRDEAVLVVADTGPGLSAEDAARVFDRFHSGGHRSGRAHYGLGLALTHEVVLRHGGRLSVLPSSDGAVFELVLPLLRQG